MPCLYVIDSKMCVDKGEREGDIIWNRNGNGNDNDEEGVESVGNGGNDYIENDDNDDDEDNDLDEFEYVSKYVDSRICGIPIIEVKHTEETKKFKAE